MQRRLTKGGQRAVRRGGPVKARACGTLDVSWHLGSWFACRW